MKLLIKVVVWTVVIFLLIALVLFLAAGTVLWPAAWIFLILIAGFTVLNTGLLFKYDPGLLQERFRSLSQPNLKTSDKVLTTVNGVLAGLVGRTLLEKRVLPKELPGYAAYMAQVKYRFVPYIW